MIDTYTVCFFGHRTINNPVALEIKLECMIRSLLTEHSYVEFLVGRNGDFDILASSVIHRCKRTVRSDNSSIVWVMPYETADYRNNRESYASYYDQIEVFGGYYKSAFQERNRSMIQRSDLAVFFVDHKGGAYQTYQYALRCGIPCINFAESGREQGA